MLIGVRYLLETCDTVDEAVDREAALGVQLQQAGDQGRAGARGDAHDAAAGQRGGVVEVQVGAGAGLADQDAGAQGAGAGHGLADRGGVAAVLRQL